MKRHKEKRKHKRFGRVFPVTFSPDSSLMVECSCDTKDISEGGMRLLMTREPLVGKEAEITFALPTCEDSLKTYTKVVWTNPLPKARGLFETGLRFMELSEKKKKHLRDYLNQAA